MQIIFNPSCRPYEYQSQGKSFQFPDLTSELCPHCNADYLKKHGYYDRFLITLGFYGEIVIRRYSCHNCNKTVSLLPSFCHPKMTYGILAVIGVLKEFYLKSATVCLALKNFFAAAGILCSRQLLLHYRRRIEKNLNRLIMAVTDVCALHAPPVTEKTGIMEKVRQLLSNIPSPEELSLKIFKRTGATYLTAFAN
jgi:hypothetical protein